MVERRELITICRQIGTMMEVGVDFLRLTRSLREQTENPRLLELYDQIEHDMRMGEAMADAIAKAPDVFSPFAVSLIRQGEARGDIEGAWHRLADFLKQEAQQDKDLGIEAEPQTPTLGARPVATSSAPRGGGIDWKRELRRFYGLGAAFLATTALVWAGAALDLVKESAMVPLQLALGALFLGFAALDGRKSTPKPLISAGNCSFCGRTQSEAGVLTRSSLVAGASICSRCASAFGESETLSEESKKRSAEQIEMARDFAVDFPARFSDRATNQPTPGVAPEFEIDGDEDEDGGTPHQEKRFQL